MERSRFRWGVVLLKLLLIAAVVGPGASRAGTVIQVTTTADDLTVNGNCTLREAIIAVNSDASADRCQAGAGADTIVLPAGNYQLAIPGRAEHQSAAGDLNIAGDLTLVGAGPQQSVIDAGKLDRVLEILSAADVSISGVSIVDGDPGAGQDGGGILVHNTARLALHDVVVEGNHVAPNQWGGGIRNNGTVTLQLTQVISNTAGYAGALCNNGTLTMTNGTVGNNTTVNFAGGIYSTGTLALDGVTLSGNTAGTNGGGLYIPSGPTELTNCTVSENKAMYGYGGGIWVYYGAGLILTNTTIGNNSAAGGAGIYYMEPDRVGDAPLVPSVIDEVKVRHSLLANNLSRNCAHNPLAPPIISLGHNLDTDASCEFGQPGDLNNIGAMLGELRDNGGPTWTQALQPGSPAIDAGDNAACPQTDQRGTIRPLDGDGDGLANCDIGAYESGVTQHSPLYLPMITAMGRPTRPAPSAATTAA